MDYIPLPSPNGGCCDAGSGTFNTFTGKASVKQSIASPSGVARILRAVFGASTIGVTLSGGGSKPKSSDLSWPSESKKSSGGGSPGGGSSGGGSSGGGSSGSDTPCANPKWIEVTYSYKRGTRTPKRIQGCEESSEYNDESYIEVSGKLYIGFPQVSDVPANQESCQSCTTIAPTCGEWGVSAASVIVTYQAKRTVTLSDVYTGSFNNSTWTYTETYDIMDAPCECVASDDLEAGVCNKITDTTTSTSLPYFAKIRTVTNAAGCNDLYGELHGPSGLISSVKLTGSTHTLSGSWTEECSSIEPPIQVPNNASVTFALGGGTGPTIKTTPGCNSDLSRPTIMANFTTNTAENCGYALGVIAPSGVEWDDSTSKYASASCNETINLAANWTHTRSGSADCYTGVTTDFCEFTTLSAKVICGSTPGSPEGPDSLDTPDNGEEGGQI